MTTIPAVPAALPDRLRCGRFELRPRQRQLLGDGDGDGEAIVLGGRAFDLLLALVQRADRVVPRHELIDAVWPGLVVEENNLSVQVNALRKALGNEAVVTVPGRGYRLAARFDEDGPSTAAGLAAESSPSPSSPPPQSPATSASPLPLPSLPRTRLPVAQPLLVGRSGDLAALGTLVEQHRLVTLVGAGGIGKTRLAQALLQLHEGRHRDGVCWVALAPVTDAEALAGAVATALGVRPPPSATGDDGIAALAQAMSGLQLLVALDNAEHLLSAVATLSQALLDAAPGVRLLVTSQAPLKLAAERVLRLAGLAIPQGVLPAAEAQAFGAIGLFAERARAADSRFALADAQVPALISLCRQLDGLPLAIELAAARVPVLGLDRLLAALPERLGLLTRNRDRHAPPRQQTLRAALEWSHELLGAPEQRLFRALAVVAGSATLALVQALAGEGAAGEGEASWAVLDALDELAQRSLVEVVVEEGNEAGNDAPRYRLLESPRALALERLAASGEDDLIRGRHARAILHQFQQAEQAMEAGETGVEAWRLDGEADLDNVREALAWAQRRGEDSLWLALATVLLPRLPAPLHDELLRHADALEARIAAAPQAADRRRAWTALSTTLSDARPQRGRAAAQRALAEARAAQAPGDDRWPLYHALCDARPMMVDDASIETAETLLREAKALEDPAWPPVRLRDAVRLQAAIALARGRADEALPLFRRMLALGQAAGDPCLGTQVTLADVELRTGDAQAAAARGTALVAQLLVRRNETYVIYARINLAAAWLALDRADAARPVLQAVWPKATRKDVLDALLDYVALLAALETRHEDAALLLGAADARAAGDSDYRQDNELRARDRAAARAREALGEARFAVLHAQGAALGPEGLDEAAWRGDQAQR